MTDAYLVRLDKAHSAAGAGDAGWNSRFTAGLKANGLMLETYKGQPLGAQGPLMAPHPYEGPDAWPESIIVEALTDSPAPSEAAA
jgi:hypothetical protein